MNLDNDEMIMLSVVLPRAAQVERENAGEDNPMAVAIERMDEKIRTYRLCNWFEFTPIECAAVIHALAYHIVYYLPSKGSYVVEDQFCRALLSRFHAYSEGILGRD